MLHVLIGITHNVTANQFYGLSIRKSLFIYYPLPLSVAPLQWPNCLFPDTSVYGCLRGYAESKRWREAQREMPWLIVNLTLHWFTGKMGQSKTRPEGQIWFSTSSQCFFLVTQKQRCTVWFNLLPLLVWNLWRLCSNATTPKIILNNAPCYMFTIIRFYA